MDRICTRALFACCRYRELLALQQGLHMNARQGSCRTLLDGVPLLSHNAMATPTASQDVSAMIAVTRPCMIVLCGSMRYNSIMSDQPRLRETASISFRPSWLTVALSLHRPLLPHLQARAVPVTSIISMCDPCKHICIHTCPYVVLIRKPRTSDGKDNLDL